MQLKRVLRELSNEFVRRFCYKDASVEVNSEFFEKVEVVLEALRVFFEDFQPIVRVEVADEELGTMNILKALTTE